MNISESKPLFTLTTQEFKEILLDAIGKQNIKTNSNLNSDEINIDEVAQIIGCKRGAIYAKTHQNAKEPIPHFKTGRGLIFLRSEILEWNKRRKIKVSTVSLDSLDEKFLNMHSK